MLKRKTSKNSKKGPEGPKAKLQRSRELFSPDEPDLSSILKVPEIGRTEESDLFDHPLHSTAVSDYEEDLDSEPDGSTSNSSELEKKNKRQSNLKAGVEREDSANDPLVEKMRAAEFTSGAENSKLPPALPLRSSSSQCMVSDRNAHSVKNFKTDKISRTNAKSQKQKESSPQVEEKDSDGPHLAKVLKRQGRGARRVTVYSAILDEFEKVTTKYKEEVELEACRKAIDNFCADFRDHLSNTIAAAEELKKTKLKNTKMVRETNKKRRRLMEVKEELIRTEPQLKKLEQDHAEIKEKISSLRNAVQLVTDLKDLRQKYVNERKQNPQENVVYGISSLPALLVESQKILGAEGHFRNINAKLEEALKLQKKK